MLNEELYSQFNITPSYIISLFRNINDDNLKKQIFEVLYNLKIKIIDEKNAQEKIEQLLSSNEEELLFTFHLYLSLYQKDEL